MAWSRHCDCRGRGSTVDHDDSEPSRSPLALAPLPSLLFTVPDRQSVCRKCQREADNITNLELVGQGSLVTVSSKRTSGAVRSGISMPRRLLSMPGRESRAEAGGATHVPCSNSSSSHGRSSNPLHSSSKGHRGTRKVRRPKRRTLSFGRAGKLAYSFPFGGHPLIIPIVQAPQSTLARYLENVPGEAGTALEPASAGCHLSIPPPTR